jgi:hypothetical protein
MREWLTMDQWKEAIQRSGYIDSEVFMAMRKGRLHNGFYMAKAVDKHF